MRGPDREVDDAVGIVCVFQDLIGTLTGFFSYASGVVEDEFPSRVIGYFVDDEDVSHKEEERSGVVGASKAEEAVLIYWRDACRLS
jgi:hypothetical protein